MILLGWATVRYFIHMSLLYVSVKWVNSHFFLGSLGFCFGQILKHEREASSYQLARQLLDVLLMHLVPSLKVDRL